MNLFLNRWIKTQDACGNQTPSLRTFDATRSLRTTQRAHARRCRSSSFLLESLETRSVLNAAPIAQADVYSAPRGATIDRAAPGWLVNDTDADGNALQIASVTAPQHGNVTWSETGNWQYTPQANFAGVDRVQYRVSDGTALSDPANVQLRVGTYSEMILADTPLAYWNFDSRQKAFDVTGRGHDGLYDGVTVGVPGAIAAESTTAAEFENGNCHVYLNLQPDLNALQKNFTIEAWIKPSALQGHGRIFTNTQFDFNRGFAFGTYENSLAFTTFAIKDYISKPVFTDLNRWYHVAVVFDASYDAAFYVDGQFVERIAGTQPPQTTENASMIGYLSVFNQRFRGTMDEVVIYDRPLTAADIARHYEMGIVHNGKISAAASDNYRLPQDTELRIDTTALETPRYSFADSFSSDTLSANFMDPAGAFYPADGQLKTFQDRQYLLTSKTDYLRGDFRFEVDLDLSTTEPLIEYIGIGSGEREGAYNEPINAIALRFHSAAAGGDLALTNAGPGGSEAFAKLNEPGYHRVRMTKTGDQLVVEVDAHFDGAFRADYVREVPSISQYAPFLNETNSRLLVGGHPIVPFDNFRVESSLEPFIEPGVLANDRDADGLGTLAARLVTSPLHGTLQWQTNGTFIYQPNAGYAGTDQFSYRVDDGSNQSNVASVTLQIISPLPEATGDRFTTAEDTELRMDDPRQGVLRNDRDPYGLPLVVTLESNTTHGTLTLNPNGTFVYLPPANFFGNDSFTYSISNGTYSTQPVLVELVVESVNDRPTTTNDEYMLDENNTISVPAARGLLINDTDVEGEALTAILQRAPSRGRATVAADGSFTYTANNNFDMTDQFTYIARDASGGSRVGTVVVKRNAPTITAPDVILRANTPGQTVDIRVAGGQLVSGLDLFLQLGDGGPELDSLGLPAGTRGPRITNIDLKSNTIFSTLTDLPVNLGSLPQLANWSISSTQGGGVPADGILAKVTIDTTGFFGGEWNLSLKGLLPTHPSGPLNTAFSDRPSYIVDGKIRVVPSEVKGRHLFYNDSAWDDENPAANSNDDAAIATDKVALKPGETATFVNYSSYTKGINGIMIDIAGLDPAKSLQPSDFRLRVGRSNTPSNWQNAPTPAIDIRRGAGIEGSDRVTLTWPEGAIKQQWLEVTVLSTANTLLANEDRFYFGSIIGEVGNQPGNTLVTSIDVISTRDNQRGPFSLATIDNIYDFNRDRIVTAADVIASRDHQTGPLTMVPLISPPTITPAAARSVFARVGDVNGDGRFDSEDLIAVFQAGQYEDNLPDNSNWFTGDWNGDGDFDTLDLVFAMQ